MRYLVPLFLFSCSATVVDPLADVTGKVVQLAGLAKYNDHSWLVPFERDAIAQRITGKIEKGEALVVHCLVPLCDNLHQGIAPTTESLGDGFSTRTNLYWATRHGMKRYFELSSSWSTEEVVWTATDTIIERVAFKRNFENGADVMLVCDAYRGDQMQSCLSDYFDYLAGKKADSLFINHEFLQTGSEADLIVFNGHNGLMEVTLGPVFASKPREKDAVVIACSSHWNFTELITYANCYPLVTTMSSMYPGATVLDYIIEKWATNESAEIIRSAAAQAYHDMKDCGTEAADALFYSGW